MRTTRFALVLLGAGALIVLATFALRSWREADDDVGDLSPRAAIDQLRIAPESSDAGYERALFPHWVDADGDGCDTREEVLIEESRTRARVDRDGCRVLAGEWLSLYDGYSTDDPAELSIDHVVALAEAWRSGASHWDGARRAAFANDLEEPGALMAVTEAMNVLKRDRDPAEWQPPNRDAWCTFADAWISTKVKWDLSADRVEVRALRNMLAGCAG